ncbi:unnamed protein product [Strongylus vulgaris]|uniref:Uncharacterized protein n=1 Tax=Strongylus vulgaris TaxID=40348 RepID=A0A3P7JY78_STRVU|nr:unnamed protein product [Strongylus vulgaris]
MAKRRNITTISEMKQFLRKKEEDQMIYIHVDRNEPSLSGVGPKELCKTFLKQFKPIAVVLKKMCVKSGNSSLHQVDRNEPSLSGVGPKELCKTFLRQFKPIAVVLKKMCLKSGNSSLNQVRNIPISFELY